MNQVNEKLKKSCEEAVVVFQKLNNKKFKEIQSKLEWCIGSYSFDNNPTGLVEYGSESLVLLKMVKSKEPRKVTKKTLDNLEKALLTFKKN